MDMRPVQSGALTPAIVNAYEHVLAAADRPTFENAVETVLSEIVPSTRFYMFECNDEAAIHLRVARYEPQIEPVIDDYIELYQAGDPLNDAVQMLGRSEVVLLRVLPEDIRQDGFREQFFRACGIVERLSLMQRTADGWRCMNISRHGEKGLCSDEELSHFVTLAQLMLPIMSRHWARMPVIMPSRSSAPQIEQRFAERHPELTPRERQVCARAAIGMSVEGTALDLGIAVTSVLTYRKRAYARLQVSSPYELACLVMR